MTTAPAESPVAARPRRPGFFTVARTVAVITLLYALVLVYPPLRLLTLLLPDWSPGTAALLAIIVLPLFGRLAHEWWPGHATRWTSAVALTWLGVCFIAFALLIPLEIALLAGLARRVAGIAGVSAAGLLTAWGMINAQRLHTREIVVDGKGKARGRLVQISDVHLGSRAPGLLKRIVARVNDAAPDVLLITGDFIDFRNVSLADLAPLKDVRAPMYFVIGNHERYVDLEDICLRLERLGVHVLRNRALGGGAFHFIGIDDAEAKDQVARHLPALPKDPERFQVLLYHRPDGLEAAAAHGMDLMLCGHTHNGQIMPFNLLVRRMFPRITGVHQLGPTLLYVSPGTGTWGPVLRLGSRSEVTVLDVR